MCRLNFYANILILFLIVSCSKNISPKSNTSAEKSYLELCQQMQNAVLINQDLNEIKRILNAGFKINDPIGCGTYHVIDGAVNRTNLEMLNFFLNAGAKPKGSALIQAVRCPDSSISLSMVKALLKAGADPCYHENYMNDKNRFSTPLHAACYLNHVEVIKLLLSQNNTNINELDLDDQTPLMCATKNGSADTLSLLMANGADPDLINSKGEKCADFIRLQIEDKESLLKLLSTYKTKAIPQKNKEEITPSK